MQVCLPERLLNLDCLHSAGDCLFPGTFIHSGYDQSFSSLTVWYLNKIPRNLYFSNYCEIKHLLVYWPLYEFLLLKIAYLNLLPIFLFKCLSVLLISKISLYNKNMFLTLWHLCLLWVFKICFSVVTSMILLLLLLLLLLWLLLHGQSDTIFL